MSVSVADVITTFSDREAQGRVLGVIIILAGWQLFAMTFPNELFPYPVEIVVFINDFAREGIIGRHLWATLYRTIFGFIAAMILGIGFGVLLGIHRTTQNWLMGYLLIGLSISGLSSAAIGLLIFGFSIFSPTFATMLAVFPYVAVNVWKGVENIEVELIEMSKSFGVSNRRILRRSILPNIAPSMFAAYRIGLATSWKIVTVVEVFGSNKGIGYQLYKAYSLQYYQRAWAWGIVFMIVVLLIEYVMIQPLERRVFKYRPDADLTF